MNTMINDFNRLSIQGRYVESIIARLDFMQIRSLLRQCLQDKKDLESNEDLKDEICSRGTLCIDDVFGEDPRYYPEDSIDCVDCSE